jgi:hypothetical protein
VPGKKTWAARPEGGLWLKWQPVFAAMSRGADLGYTTGPAEFRKNKEDEKPFGYGQYISIWRKQKDGAWKVALDVGHGNPRPPNPPGEPELSFPSEGADVQANTAGARRSWPRRRRNSPPPRRTTPQPPSPTPLAMTSASIAKRCSPASAKMPSA